MTKTLGTTIAFLALAAAPALAAPGGSESFGEKDWSAVNGMTSLGGKLYVSTDLHLWEVDKKGNAKPVPAKADGWGRSNECTPLEGNLYCVNEEMLWEVTPGGKLKNLGKEWFSVPGMAALDGKLYIIADEGLYQVERTDGKYTKLSDDWYNVAGMVALDGSLYIMSRDQLHAVDKTGAKKTLEGTYNSPTGVAAANGKLYVVAYERTDGGKLINEAVLYQVDKTGKREKLELPKGWDKSSGVNAVTALDGKLYLATPSFGPRVYLYSLDVK